MAFDFEALVGHLYVVGGRSISATPPGSLVEVAPQKVARGRELDTFFILVLPSGEVTAPVAFYEQMASLAAERYFNSTGSVTAGLRSVFISLNQDLYEHNTGGAKRQYEASTLCAVLRGDELFLGRVGAGVGLYLCDGEVTPFPTEFQNDDALFGPPMGIHPVPDIKMSRYTVAQGARMILADVRLADADMEKMRAALGRNDIAEVLNGFKEVAGSGLTLMAAEFVPPEAPSPIPVKEAHSTARAPEPKPVPAAEAAPPAPVAETPKPPRGSPVLGAAALKTAGAMDKTNHLLGRIFPAPEEGKRPFLRPSAVTGAAILLPVSIVVLVMVMFLSGTDSSQFDLCVQEAQKAAILARSITSSDRNGTLAAWKAVNEVVTRCNKLRAGDPSLAALTREGQNVVDHLFQIERRETNVLASFPNATISHMVLQGTFLYVLDSEGQQVSQLSLGQDGRSVVSRQFIPSMRINATVQNRRITGLVDLFWSEDTTQILALDKSGVLVECSPRFLQSCDSQQLLNAENWNRPIAVTSWQGKLYILDPGANQIWRYEASGGTYANSPIEYFQGDNRPDLRSAVDFSIDDDKGSVYILLANGTVLRFVSGNQVPFAFTGFPGEQTPKSADALFLNNDPTSLTMFVTSQADRTIYETTHGGTFTSMYRAFNEDNFATLSDLSMDANQQVIYAASGNTIYWLERLRTQ
jgi:hypothetical protein